MSLNKTVDDIRQASFPKFGGHRIAILFKIHSKAFEIRLASSSSAVILTGIVFMRLALWVGCARKPAE
ncbi:hypothetical protein [Roseibium sp.]|uniref:hypothetical protein n=1 Tax=Roseibium sp. TaxID=1936156 RepID=UPI003B523F99